MTDVAPGTRMADWLEQAWLDRYLARQLGPAESEWFEAYMLDKKELLQQVENDTDLHEAFMAEGNRAAVEGAPHAPSLAEAKQREPDSGSAPHPRSIAASHRRAHAPGAAGTAGTARARWMHPLAAAAGLFLALGLGWFVRARMDEQTLGSVHANPTRIIFDASRSIFSHSRLEHEDSASEWLLVDVGVPTGAQDVTLVLGSEPQRRLDISPDGFVNFLVLRTAASRAGTAKVSYMLQGKKEELNLDLSRALAGSAP